MPKFWITNALLFQAAWFSAALLTEYSVAIILVILFVHFCLSDKPRADGKILLLAPIGWIADYTLVQQQVFAADGGFPIWLGLIWCMFILSLNHSLAWLNKLNVGLVALIGAMGGASSYLAATRLQALHTPLPMFEFLAIIGVTWAILMPCLARLGLKLVAIKPAPIQS